jgi:hypothetical protein
MGAWCGYVGTPPGHPWRDRDLEGDGAPAVHGGVTYQAPCHGDVCHVPSPGEPDDVMWIGFDCAHAGDLILIYQGGSGVYRDVAYARGEVEQLADQVRIARSELRRRTSSASRRMTP